MENNIKKIGRPKVSPYRESFRLSEEDMQRMNIPVR